MRNRVFINSKVIAAGWRLSHDGVAELERKQFALNVNFM